MAKAFGSDRVRSDADPRVRRGNTADMAQVVAVIGAGNVGCALAADLMLRGFQVRLCTRSEVRLALLRAAGAITITGEIAGSAPLPLLTTSMGRAVAGATTWRSRCR